MFKWLLNKFKKPAYTFPEMETYEVGEVDLIFMFKDETSYRRSFIGDVSISTTWGVDGHDDNYIITHAQTKAIAFIEDRQNFGWLMKDENTLVPMSDVTEIIVAKHLFSITV